MSAPADKDKYYRIMKTPAEDWEPYREEPMYDEHPDFGVYKSTFGVNTPKEGDYIIQAPNGCLRFERPTDYDDNSYKRVEFDAMPPLGELLDNGTVIEVPNDMAALEFKLSRERVVLYREELCYAEDAMRDAEKQMAKRKFGFPTKAAREARKEYAELKPMVVQMQRRYDELKAMLQEQVVQPAHRLRACRH